MSAQAHATTTDVDATVEVVCGACRATGRDRKVTHVVYRDGTPDWQVGEQQHRTGLAEVRRLGGGVDDDRAALDEFYAAARIAIEQLRDDPDPAEAAKLRALIREVTDADRERFRELRRHRRSGFKPVATAETSRSTVLEFVCLHSGCRTRARYKLGKVHAAADRALVEGRSEVAFPDDFAGL